MRNTYKIISALLIIATMTIALSCKESFTEQDALKAQQSIDLALYIVNQSDPGQAPITGAKVTINQNGVNKEATTDTNGAALFPAMKIGDFIYKVEATNFLTISAIGTANPTNFRQAQSTVKIGVLSTADADLATVKGVITLDKDITNNILEVAPPVDVTLTVAYTGYGTRVFTAKSDANGAYSFKIPVNAVGSTTTVSLSFPDVETDQTYGVNKYADEIGFFPTVLPRKETAKTIFSMSLSGEQNRSLPGAFTVRSIYGIVDAPPSGGTQAVVSSVTTNSLGVVTGVSFSDGGNYAGDADGKVTIAITSIDGGTGASIVVTLNANTSVSTAYSTLANRVVTGGSGYPANSSGSSLNKTGTIDPSFKSGFNVQKGGISVANASYGTGIYRPRSIQ